MPTDEPRDVVALFQAFTLSGLQVALAAMAALFAQGEHARRCDGRPSRFAEVHLHNPVHAYKVGDDFMGMDQRNRRLSEC